MIEKQNQTNGFAMHSGSQTVTCNPLTSIQALNLDIDIPPQTLNPNSNPYSQSLNMKVLRPEPTQVLPAKPTYPELWSWPPRTFSFGPLQVTIFDSAMAGPSFSARTKYLPANTSESKNVSQIVVPELFLWSVKAL